MTPELKALWLNALRSGEYSQTYGTLKGGAGYCCLGVLCHVANEAGALPSGTRVEEKDNQLLFIVEDEDAVHEEEAELPDGSFGLPDRVIGKCIEWNDEDRADFATIADRLETTLAEESAP